MTDKLIANVHRTEGDDGIIGPGIIFALHGVQYHYYRHDLGYVLVTPGGPMVEMPKGVMVCEHLTGRGNRRKPNLDEQYLWEHQKDLGRLLARQPLQLNRGDHHLLESN